MTGRGGVLAAGALMAFAAPLPAQVSEPATAVERVVPANTAQMQMSYAPAVRIAAPAVVNIYTRKTVPTPPRSRAEWLSMQFGGNPPPPRVVQSLGSGVIVDKGGLIVTNGHVVAGADQITVALADRREFPATIVFSDNRTDLAVLRIDTKGAELPIVEFADSDLVEVGDIVLAIGDPFGVGQTVTHGIISGLGRNNIGRFDRQFFLQTDAAINPGNSGGALLDLQGKLVGINSGLASDTGNSVGIGFAIPANMVRVFLKAANSGKLVTGWIGAEGEGLTITTARAAGLDRPQGVLLTGIAPGSPAAVAGLRVGDIITAVDNKPISDAGTLRYRIATQGVGETASVSLLRGGKQLVLPVRLAAPPETPPRQVTPMVNNNVFSGVTVANMSPAFAQELGLGLPEKGVVVVAIPDRSPALQMKMLPGAIVEAVNGEEVRSVADLKRITVAPTTQLRYNNNGVVTTCTIAARGAFTCTT